ncbi:exported hypothetical protein [Vibrio nigripulchritudo SOn1]|uniref:Uncharacterized protein n=1 Tax=Vibrio nigripulchritudo SOn1 TaxID=1238450 RepID=A0AAV2VSP9_9VIBR|nr:hypothetical protein [Vibrio nigripulchritudo]CCO47435.1 exported hypothetical protein [Vibrio nigripulchritudo SOn1]
MPRRWINRNVVRALLFIAVSLVGTNAVAGNYTGTFHPYWYGGSLYIKPVSVVKSDIPACAKRQLLRLQEMDISGDVFKYKYSMLLTAWAANKSIKLLGTNKCTSEGDEIIYVVNYPQ